MSASGSSNVPNASTNLTNRGRNETRALLTLARAFKYFGFGNLEDYVVLDGDRVVGRIFKPPQALSYRPWFWTITAIDKTPTVDIRGYAATREDAMSDFNKRWSVE